MLTRIEKSKNVETEERPPGPEELEIKSPVRSLLLCGDGNRLAQCEKEMRRRQWRQWRREIRENFIIWRNETDGTVAVGRTEIE